MIMSKKARVKANRIVTVNGLPVRYKYNRDTREVSGPGFESFKAECWDAAPDQVREALLGQRA